MNTCVFCRIVHGQDPARIVYQDEDVTAFHDLNPQAPLSISSSSPTATSLAWPRLSRRIRRCWGSCLPWLANWRSRRM